TGSTGSLAYRSNLPVGGDLPSDAGHVDGHLAAQTDRGDGPSARWSAAVLAARLRRLWFGTARASATSQRFTTAADGDCWNRIGGHPDRFGRLDQRQLCRLVLWLRLSQVPRLMVAGNRFL